MTCIGIGCAIVELLVAEKAAPASDAITLLDESPRMKKQNSRCCHREKNSLFFRDFNYPWSFAVAVFAARIRMALEMIQRNVDDAAVHEWWRSINGLLCSVESVEFDDCTTRRLVVSSYCATIMCRLNDMRNFTLLQSSPIQPTRHRHVPGCLQ